MHVLPFNLTTSRSGNVMVIAMLILGAGTFGLAAWTSLVFARSNVVEATESALDRRVRLENSRQVGREWVYRKMVGEQSGSGTTQPIPDGWGQIESPSFAVSYLGTQTKAPYNRTSPMPRGAFGASIDVIIEDGAGSNTGRFFINSVHPTLAGDLLVVHNPPAGYTSPPVSGDLRVEGRAVLMSSEPAGNSFKAEQVAFPLANGTVPVTSDLKGNSLLPDNYPFSPLSTGKGGATPWSGELNVVNNPNNVENSIYHKVTSGDYTIVDGLAIQSDPNGPIYVPGDGTVTVNLGNSGLKDVVISQNVTTLILRGQLTGSEKADADLQPPVTILVVDPSVAMVTCVGENLRQMVFAIRGDTYYRTVPLEFATNVGFPVWRMIMEIENVLIKTYITGNGSQLDLIGGIRTNAGFYVESATGPLFLEAEEKVEPLGTILTRHAWIESYVQPGT